MKRKIIQTICNFFLRPTCQFFSGIEDPAFFQLDTMLSLISPKEDGLLEELLMLPEGQTVDIFVKKINDSAKLSGREWTP